MGEMSNVLQGDLSGAGVGAGAGVGVESSISHSSQRGIQGSVGVSDYYVEMTGDAVVRTTNENSMDIVGDGDTNVGKQNERMTDQQRRQHQTNHLAKHYSSPPFFCK